MLKQHANVFLEPDQVSPRYWQRRDQHQTGTSRLTGFEIDVYRNTVDEIEIDDVDLEEFKDEIDDWSDQRLKGIGCDTARNVLELKKGRIAPPDRPRRRPLTKYSKSWQLNFRGRGRKAAVGSKNQGCRLLEPGRINPG